jgi:hypothetical protein
MTTTSPSNGDGKLREVLSLLEKVVANTSRICVLLEEAADLAGKRAEIVPEGRRLSFEKPPPLSRSQVEARACPSCGSERLTLIDGDNWQPTRAGTLVQRGSQLRCANYGCEWGFDA